MSSTETEVDIDAEQDLRDVFKLMYDDEDDWAIEEVRLNLRRGTIADSRTTIHH
jgi:2-phospho-L-lactate guanylyltransferase (CobY/MobA/RfbA family)